MPTEQAVNPLPPVIVVLALITVLVEVVFTLAAAGIVGGAAGIGWRLQAMTDYGFSPAVLDWIMTRGDYSFQLTRRLLTYAFVQTDFLSAIFVAAMLLALGKFVGEVFHWAATLTVFLLSTLFGALVFGVLVSGTTPLIGGFPGVFGLIGAFTYILWLRLGQMGSNQLQAFQLIGLLLALQLFYGLVFGSNLTWIAELAGFAIGFASSTILAPGGLAALKSRMRERR
jgi:hypothetical protein